MGALTKIFGTHSERELKRIYPLVDKVEPAMKYMAQKLKKETAEKRLLIVSTDGCSNSGRDGIQKTIKELSRYGILVVGAGIGSARAQVENEFGKNFIDIGNLEAMPQILCNIVKRNLA